MPGTVSHVVKQFHTIRPTSLSPKPSAAPATTSATSGDSVCSIRLSAFSSFSSRFFMAIPPVRVYDIGLSWPSPPRRIARPA